MKAILCGEWAIGLASVSAAAVADWKIASAVCRQIVHAATEEVLAAILKMFMFLLDNEAA